MTSRLPLLLAMSLFGAQIASASPFTGTWVADLDTQAGLGRDIYLVADGAYSCESCNPARHYPADGKFHAIAGDPDVEAEAVSTRGPRTIVTLLVEHSMTRTTTMTVSRDNRSATYVSIDHRQGIRRPLKTVYLARRVSDGPKGSHLVSGTWQGIAYQEVPELIRTTRLRDTGRTFTYYVPTGATYTASFDGAPVPVTGAGITNMKAAVKRVGAREIVETRARGDKVIMERKFTLSPDARKLTIASFYPNNGSSFTISAHRKR